MRMLVVRSVEPLRYSRRENWVSVSGDGGVDGVWGGGVP